MAYEMEHEDEERGLRGWKSWLKRWNRDDEFEDESDEHPSMSGGTATTTQTIPSTGMGTTIRLATVRDSAITIMPAATFDDIQRAADRLKRGEPQIINLESTPQDMAERLIDFLNGVTYALDGCVEKVAEGAYLFTPATIAIRSDSESSSTSSVGSASGIKPPWKI
jgi:cell division inhibitor SepF